MKNLDKIIGHKKQIERLKVVCDILADPEKYRKFDTEVPNSLLLYGAAGVGKKFIAKTVSEGCGRALFRITESDCSPRTVKRIFRQARKSAPSAILIDELDCYTQEFYRVLDAEMECLDGDEVFFVATYDGDEEKMDSELGGLDFDFKIEISPVAFDDKYKILQMLFRNKVMEEGFDPEDFCYFAQEFSCGGVEETYRMASVRAIHEGRDKVGIDHLIKAGLELQKTPLATDFSEQTAYHEAGHAAVSLLLGKTPAFVVLDEGGGFCYAKIESAKTFGERKVLYTIALGGKACEDVFFPAGGIGSLSDLDKVKKGLEHEISDLASLGFEFFDATRCESPAYNDLLAKKVREELENYYTCAKKLIEENRPLIVAIVERLKEKHYLLHSEIVGIFDEYRSAAKK